MFVSVGVSMVPTMDLVASLFFFKSDYHFFNGLSRNTGDKQVHHEEINKYVADFAPLLLMYRTATFEKQPSKKWKAGFPLEKSLKVVFFTFRAL